ncbi:hypothetical protein [Devosia limi]|nr:hypothetical protein [Devosia limi]
MMDLQQAFDEGFEAVKQYVDGELSALAKRLDALEGKSEPVSVAGAVVDREGHLILTMSDGATKDVGLICGKDGATEIVPPVPAASESANELTAILKRLDTIEATTPPAAVSSALIDRGGHLVLTLTDGATKDVGPVCGTDGKPGEPGLGFDDLAVAHDGERGLTLSFTRGEQVKEFPMVLPIVIDRGIHREGDIYAKGDGVTWAGSFWISQKDDNGDKPGGSPETWRLSVKKGRDGKDAVVREQAAPTPIKLRG